MSECLDHLYDTDVGWELVAFMFPCDLFLEKCHVQYNTHKETYKYIHDQWCIINMTIQINGYITCHTNAVPHFCYSIL